MKFMMTFEDFMHRASDSHNSRDAMSNFRRRGLHVDDGIWKSLLFKSNFNAVPKITFMFLFPLPTHRTNLAQGKEKEKEEFVCPTNVGNGNFADPATCRRFYQVKFNPVW
jgi:hypothetical protein